MQIDKLVKIGVTRNIRGRLKAFQTSAAVPELLLLIPGGDLALERKLHGLLAEHRVVRELFHRFDRVQQFIDIYKYAGLERGIQYLENTTPAARRARTLGERAERVMAARQTKAEFDAHCASLVAERKARLGW